MLRTVIPSPIQWQASVWRGFATHRIERMWACRLAAAIEQCTLYLVIMASLDDWCIVRHTKTKVWFLRG